MHINLIRSISSFGLTIQLDLTLWLESYVVHLYLFADVLGYLDVDAGSVLYELTLAAGFGFLVAQFEFGGVSASFLEHRVRELCCPFVAEH